ncbi:hypothetical protein MPH_05361 [Macrophomina phaseolina MS6]|uniref:Uncharacterized protein n=1 Tax=Macrophomina phaseolina (strain MS6) TaxID=1126212 RepID=K2SKX6_MACPH|nr:hypothetical protein MPH_05361 [Macrophomina phaseolina MS6]
MKASDSSFNETVNGVPWSEFCNTVKAEDNNKTVDVPEGIGPPKWWQYRWFTTNNGYLGICGVDVRPKDEIFCLAGCQVPFILRDLSEGKTGQNVRLVGDSHVHGTMKGEAMAFRAMEELSTFIIR